ncbi:hypothetical protein [Burkholderia stagnalis]|uniref:hypothetical protein n=1 Tax=Burkholderia stagnalis TaxID=1503054 RepID=UPI0012DA86EC|nr:hypothetical protein [Burkholderia stagnalis]
MDTVDSDAYECFHCGRQFRTTVFEVIRERERMHFDTDPPTIEVQEAEGLECYCSCACLAARAPIVMAREKTPIRSPGFGPVEVCARCEGPVDMTRFHLTYLASSAMHEGFAMRTLEVDYLAVVCDHCSNTPTAQARTVSEATTN